MIDCLKYSQLLSGYDVVVTLGYDVVVTLGCDVVVTLACDVDGDSLITT